MRFETEYNVGDEVFTDYFGGVLEKCTIERIDVEISGPDEVFIQYYLGFSNELVPETELFKSIDLYHKSHR